MAAKGPCDCGSYDCSSCGPAQGSRKCELHGRYACDPCEEHFNEYSDYPELDYPEPDED